MITLILAILLLITVPVCIGQFLKMHALFEENVGLHQDLIDAAEQLSLAHKREAGFEEGMTEMQENYEVDFIGFREQLEKKDEQISQLSEDLEAHRKFCLPVLTEIRAENP